LPELVVGEQPWDCAVVCTGCGACVLGAGAADVCTGAAEVWTGAADWVVGVAAGEGALLAVLGTVRALALALGGLATDATGVACELQPAKISEARATAPKVIFFIQPPVSPGSYCPTWREVAALPIR